MPTPINTSRSRIALLLLFSVAAVALLYHFSAFEFLRSGGAERALRDLGPEAPFAFVLLMGLLMALWVPGTLIVLVGAAVFPPNTALLLNYLGSLTAALFGFAVARAIGGAALQDLVAKRAPGLIDYQRRLATDGFLTIFYLRLIPTPFNAISYLAGLSPIPAATYLSATALAILPGSFAFTTILSAALASVHARSILPLFELRPLAGLVVFAGALLLPPLLKARFFPAPSSGNQGPR